MRKGPKFHIRCDMEGVSGIVSPGQVDPAARGYPEGRAWFMAELSALVDGLVDGGAGEISIYDEHWNGHNIDLQRIPSGVRVFAGKPPYRDGWAGGLDASHAGMILHGFHSMAGSGHLLCHTYEPDFSAISLNGIRVGEIGVETAIAGDCGVPLALVIADSAGVEEAARLVPGVASVTTKISHGETGAECFALTDTLDSIRMAAAQLARGGVSGGPWRLGGPIEMLCSFNAGPYLDRLREHAADHFVAANTLRLVGLSVLAVWADYWRRKLRVQQSLRSAS